MSKSILIVDDEPPILQLLQEALTVEGYDVETAANATEALELVKEKLFAAAILDFDLPDMNGVMLHSRIRQMDGELAQATLFISGLAQSDDDLSYYAMAGAGFYSKPFDVRDLLDGLRKLTDTAS